MTIRAIVKIDWNSKYSTMLIMISYYPVFISDTKSIKIIKQTARWACTYYSIITKMILDNQLQTRNVFLVYSYQSFYLYFIIKRLTRNTVLQLLMCYIEASTYFRIIVINPIMIDIIHDQREQKFCC